MRVLVVEDNDVESELLRNALNSFGYDVTVAKDGRQALDLVRSGKYKLIVSDWEMPELTGIDLCRQIRAKFQASYVYVILLTSRMGPEYVVEGLEAGADDFISKPFHPQELRVRLRAGERVLALQSRDLTIFSLAKLAESRDTDTGAHLERMREYSRIIATRLATYERYRDELDGDVIELIYLTSPLHDIGKVGIPDRVLLKQGPLTDDEFEIMKQHTVIGGRTLEAAMNAYPDAQFLRMARDIALTHHERYDGNGYPHGLAGQEIPLCGRIVAVADVYDALTSKRVYKEAYSHIFAKELVEDDRGKRFDPDVVDAFVECEQEILDVRERFGHQDQFDFFLSSDMGQALVRA
jgi:putative two-component system response regulator